MTTHLTPEELAMLDRWIEVAHGAPWNDAEEAAIFSEKITALSEEGDLWNSNWGGFGSTVTIGSGTDVFLYRCIESALDDAGLPSDEEFDREAAIESFRRALRGGAESGFAFGARELLGTSKTAYLVEMVGERGELESFWLSPTVEEAEEEVRSYGVIFPEGYVPSGKVDRFTDDQIIVLLKEYEAENGVGGSKA